VTSELTARTALVVAFALVEAGRDADSHRAHALAVGLGSRPVQAKAVNGQARIHQNSGDRSAALAYQDRAVELAKGSGPLEAGIRARRAELRAGAGDDAGAMRDLEAAGHAIGAGAWEWWCHNPQNEADLGAYRSSVLTMLGRHREAVDAFEWVLGRMDTDKTLWRAKIAADRDRALAAL
jgi:hypothetical protein